MTKNIRSIVIPAVLAFIVVLAAFAQQKSADTAIDPVCGMTVVKANAKATFDYKGTTYYFCNPGCKESFAKDPEKYLKAQQAKAAAVAAPMVHKEVEGFPLEMKHGSMAGCPMCGGQGTMHGGMGMGMRGRGMMPGGPMAPGLGQIFRLYGDKVEIVVENAKDGAALKVTSKDPEVAKAIQVHLAEHVAMMKKMKEAAAEAACADCAMIK